MTDNADKPEITDRIEKRFEVGATRDRVWRALADSEEFGTWFGMKFNGPFAPGAKVIGQLTKPGYDHITVEFAIETMEPEGYFSYRWHPGAIDPEYDYSAEPTTLVEFSLQETTAGTAVTIIESGFDRLPASRRAEAFRMNQGGWTGQSKNLAGYVA